MQLRPKRGQSSIGRSLLIGSRICQRMFTDLFTCGRWWWWSIISWLTISVMMENLIQRRFCFPTRLQNGGSKKWPKGNSHGDDSSCKKSLPSAPIIRWLWWSELSMYIKSSKLTGFADSSRSQSVNLTLQRGKWTTMCDFASVSVLSPCAHSYNNFCLSEWNVSAVAGCVMNEELRV